MRRSGGQKGAASKIAPSSSAEHTFEEGTNSASLARAERQIKTLEEENAKLRNDLSEMSTMYHQLVRESSHERYDERRVTMLKAHIIQLERQMITLAEAQSSRTFSLMEVENALTVIADCARTYLAEEKAFGSTVGQIPMSSSDINRIVDTAESARIKLFKGVENANQDKLQRPLLMMDRFVKQSTWEPASLMDVCSGKLEHLNLKHVGKLESKLAQLYKQLMLVNLSLHAIVSVDKDDVKPANKDVPLEVYIRLAGEVSHACNQLKSSTKDLLDLSVLVPAAPWPALQKPYLDELTTERVMKSLPNFPKGKAAEGRHMIEVLMKAIAYDNHMRSLEVKCLEEELHFHQAIYNLQTDYIQALFTSVREGYVLFEDSTNTLLCKPLTAILEQYEDLKDSASEDALREFLSVFKQYADQIREAIDSFHPKETTKGTAALSEFGDNFLESLKKMKQECQQKRDGLVKELEMVKEQRKSHIDEILQIFEQCEDREPSNKASTDYNDIVTKVTDLSLETDCPTPGVSGRPAQRSEVISPTRDQNRATVRSRNRPPTCSCGVEHRQDGQHDCPDVKQQPGTMHRQVKRPSSLSRTASDGENLKSGQFQTPRRSKLPSMRPLPTPGERDLSGSKLAMRKSSSIPGVTPKSVTKRFISPTASERMTPIAKLSLKPRPVKGGSVDREDSTISNEND